MENVPRPPSGGEPTVWDVWAMLWSIDSKLGRNSDRVDRLEDIETRTTKRLESLERSAHEFITKRGLVTTVVTTATLAASLMAVLKYFIGNG